MLAAILSKNSAKKYFNNFKNEEKEKI